MHPISLEHLETEKWGEKKKEGKKKKKNNKELRRQNRKKKRKKKTVNQKFNKTQTKNESVHPATSFVVPDGASSTHAPALRISFAEAAVFSFFFFLRTRHYVGACAWEHKNRKCDGTISACEHALMYMRACVCLRACSCVRVRVSGRSQPSARGMHAQYSTCARESL